jgi:hypothetical protein
MISKDTAAMTIIVISSDSENEKMFHAPRDRRKHAHVIYETDARPLM